MAAAALSIAGTTTTVSDPPRVGIPAPLLVACACRLGAHSLGRGSLQLGRRREPVCLTSGVADIPILSTVARRQRNLVRELIR